MTRYRSIFISDTHFGFRHNRSDLLTNFLASNTCEHLYLVGDIIDLWELKRKSRWTMYDTLAVRQILSKKSNGTKITYIVGNHDGDLRAFIKKIDVDNMTFANECTHVGPNGKKYLVVHGDIFDNSSAAWTLLSKVGSRAYDLSIVISKHINQVRETMGLEPWSLALYLKQKVKGASKYIRNYEQHMAEYCDRGDYDGIICGHIHDAKISSIQHQEWIIDRVRRRDFVYLNTGDWVESCTALVEHFDGRFEIIKWLR